MLRAVVVIAGAILVANPALGPSTAKRYAAELQRSAQRFEFDPFTAVAIGENESRWHPGAVGGANGRCVGLFQECVVSTTPACREDWWSAPCQRRVSALRDPAFAIGVLGKSIDRWRKYCRRRTGRDALFHRWLAGYQGVDGVSGTTCGQRKIGGRWRDAPLAPVTKKVIGFRKKLLRLQAKKQLASRAR